MDELVHIAVIDDDSEIRKLLHEFLSKYAYHVSVAKDAKELYRLLEEHQDIKLLILDIMLPGSDGLQICQQLRQSRNQIPIIMLTAAIGDSEKIIGLEFGADDYLTKPFNPRELLARIKAVLRRTNNTNEQIGSELSNNTSLLKFAGWSLNTASRQLFSPDNIEVTLSSKGYDILVIFLEHPQRVLSRDQLLTILSNRSAEPYDRSIDVQIGRLRQKLGDDPRDPKLIKTVRSGGYLFAVPVQKSL
jgi:two-component system OmpR family response regulator